MYKFMTKNEFTKMIDNMVYDYSTLPSEDRCNIMKYLHGRLPDTDSLLNINPIDVICGIADCHEMDMVALHDSEKGFEYSVRFEILSGICRMFRNVVEPKNAFKYLDIVEDTRNGRVMYVMHFHLGKYYLDGLDGQSYVYHRESAESNLRKIGEVTKELVDSIIRKNRS